MNIIASNQATDSPFDQIKKIDEQGYEYWLARDLMSILGYQQWRQFEDAIDRAIAACDNIGQDSKKHFLRLPAKSSGGRPRDDFKLSRHGCYLTAMNGDSRKSEIAAAQNYFAYKTHEAELFTQNSELLTQLLERLEQRSQIIKEQGKAIAQLQAQVQNLLPPSSDFMPPGWDEDVWRSLPPQDKSHFRFLFRRRGFRPSPKNEPLALPAVDTEQIKQKQRDEVARLIGEVSPEEKQQFQAAKRQQLREFWSQAPVENQENMPF
ncbi:BRO family protein [Aulosira sp. FACHB-615]|uniref:BRO family protein n=1 Tax=Aulosira sp. FACHB-615 TaxID=2692777 RepID=UPI0016874457|nr:BRO family protein [Aulosira sp. FACHB-615]MBD2491704.1 DNA-damage-inducible protein [Aulosira sp. FACHB-615]